jgi:FtsP/CotA-like multicopper oxidase with cupredoxin domain/peroxiredoxin
MENAMRTINMRLGVLAWSLAVFMLGGRAADAEQGKANPQEKARRVKSVPLQREFARASSSALNTPYRKPAEAEKAQVNGRDCFELCVTTGTFETSGAAGVDCTIPNTFERLCYNGQYVGPTIRVKPNEHFFIRLKNDMSKKSTGVPDNDPSASPEGEQPHGFLVTNLHTHGLHVSPDGNSDNIFRSVNPGCSFDFEYNLDVGDPKRRHPSGTFWYHPHNHGSVAYQLSNGLSGALIVEGDPKNCRDLESIPEIYEATTNGHERILVLQLFNYRKCPDNVGRMNPNSIYNVTLEPTFPLPINLTGDKDSPNGQVTAINGDINPTFTIAPGEVQRWRIIHAGWDLLRQLIWVDEHDKPTNDVQFNEIAIDGLATGTMKVRTPLEIAPGQRSDVLIRIDPKTSVGKKYHLKQKAVPSALATNNLASDINYLAKLVVQGAPQSMTLPNLHDDNTVKMLAGCRPFEPVKRADVYDSNGKPTATLLDGINDGSHNGLLNFLGTDDVLTYTLNGQTFHQLEPVVLNIGVAQEWNVKSLVGSHPFHIHVNPFQVISYTDPSGKKVPMNVWRDTLYIPEGSSYTIRSRFQDFVGDSVLHCHILDHEDQGMMLCLRFKDPSKGGKVAKGPGYNGQSLQLCNRAAPELRLPDVFGKERKLADFREHGALVVFFRGMGCSHCTTELRNLIAKARAAKGFDAEILAVSSEAIADGAQALKDLDVTESDRFQLLVDADHKAFREWDCMGGNDPKHGLFLIDPQGVIRAQYTGESAFRITKDSFDRIKTIEQSILRVGDQSSKPQLR